MVKKRGMYPNSGPFTPKNPTSLARGRVAHDQLHSKDIPDTKKFGLKRPPKDELSITILADELVDWARSSSALTLKSFPISKGYSPMRFYQLADISEYFKDALDLAREAIGDRREIKVFSPQIVINTMHLYDHEVMAWAREKNAQEKDKSNGPITVVMNPIENSSMVPVKQD